MIEGFPFYFHLHKIFYAIIDDVLSLDDDIQILRKKLKDYNNIDYKPIVDWYYKDEITLRSLEDITSDSYDPLDEQEREKKELEMMKKQYLEDKPYLISMSVEDVLIEMLERNKVL